jgi:hypothetical protein
MDLYFSAKDLALKSDIDIEGRSLAVAYDTWSYYYEHLYLVISRSLDR